MSPTGQASSTDLEYKVYSQTRYDREHPFSVLINTFSDQNRGATFYNTELKRLRDLLLEESVANVQVIVTDSDFSSLRGVSFRTIVMADEHPLACSLSLAPFEIQRFGDTRGVHLSPAGFPVAVPSDDRLPTYLKDLVETTMADTSLNPQKQHLRSMLTKVVTATGFTEKLVDEVAKAFWAHPHFGKCDDPECGYDCPIVVISKGSKESTESCKKIQTTDLSPGQVNSLAEWIRDQEARGQQLTTLLNSRKPTVCYALGTDPDSPPTTLFCARVEDPSGHLGAEQEGVMSDTWVVTHAPLSDLKSLDTGQLGETFQRLTRASKPSGAYHQAGQGMRPWRLTGISIYAEPWISAHKAQVSAAEEK